MGLYLVDYVRSGRRVNAAGHPSGAWIPAGYDLAPCRWMALGRPDRGGKALVEFDAPVTAPRIVKLAETFDETAGASARAALRSFANDGRDWATGVTAAEVTVDLCLRALSEKGAHDVQPSRYGNRLVREVWFHGQRLFAEDLGAFRASQYFADTFTDNTGNLAGRSVETATTSTTWSEPIGTAFIVTGGEALAENIPEFTDQVGLISQACDTDAFFSECGASGTWNNAGTLLQRVVMARMNAGITNGFSAGIQDDGTLGWFVYEWNGDAFAATGSGDFRASVLRVTCNGTTVTFAEDGNALYGPTTNATQTTGSGNRFVGISTFVIGGSSASDVGFVSYLGGDIGATPPGATTKQLAALGVG